MAENKQHISQMELPHDRLLDWAAAISADKELLEFENEQLNKLLDLREDVMKFQSALFSKLQVAHDVLSVLNSAELKIESVLMRLEGQIDGRNAQLKIMARKGANAVHSRPGGSRDKQELIRKTWASGKYTSRDICAEQECAALGMSFSTARKALRGTPNPG